MEAQRGRGRPQKPAGRTKGELLQIRVGDGERIEYQKAAERSGLSLSEWVRTQLNRAAKRQATEA